MAIFSFGDKRVQQRSSTSATDNNKQRDCDSSRRNRRTSNKFSNWTRLLQLELHDIKSRSSIPVHDDLSRSRNDKPNRDSKNNRGYKRNRYHKCLYPIIGLLIASPVNAADVGGVSATANPIANSSGSGDQPGNSGFTRSIYHQHIWWWYQLSRSNCKLHSIYYSCDK